MLIEKSVGLHVGLKDLLNIQNGWHVEHSSGLPEAGLVRRLDLLRKFLLSMTVTFRGIW